MADTHFEFVSKYKDCGLDLPKRETANSAGYDLFAVEDTVIPSYWNRSHQFSDKYDRVMFEGPMSLADTKVILSANKGIAPTLVPLGVKCYLQPNQYLKIVARSSIPLKDMLILANGNGIIDADYADNPSNEGEIFGQFINFSPVDIIVHKGDRICQGIIETYDITVDDAAAGDRLGGFGSTAY